MYPAVAQFNSSALTQPNFAAIPPRISDSSVHMTTDWTTEETRHKIKCLFYSEAFVSALEAQQPSYSVGTGGVFLER